MKLILVRHAEAVPKSAPVRDEVRYLTPAGRESFRRTARTMAKRGVDPAYILTSPLVRAVQTADILAEVLKWDGPLLVRDELGPGFDLVKLQELLQEYASAAEVVVVGHEPDLSGITASLLSLADGFDFKKGAAVKLKVDPGELQKSVAFKWMAVGKKLVITPDEYLA